MGGRGVWAALAAMILCVFSGLTAVLAESETAPAPLLSPPLLAARPMPRLLFPANHVTLNAASFDVIAAAPPDQTIDEAALALTVDDQTQSWSAAAPPALVARVNAAPGIRTLRIGQDSIVFFVMGGDATPPSDWPELRRHPLQGEGAARCMACHEGAASETMPSYTPPAPGEACGNCHSADDFAVAHGHVAAPLSNCAMCHAVHGAIHKGLLKAPAKQLCSECHD